MTDDRTRIVLCGGSSATHVLAADLGRRGDFDIRVLTNRPQDWGDQIHCEEHRNRWPSVPYVVPARIERYSGRIDAVFGWDQAAEALAGADVVVLGCPVHAHRDLLRHVLPALDTSRDTVLGSLYAQGGFDWIVRDVAAQFDLSLDRVALFGLKRFPFLCKKQDYGNTVTLFGRFPGIFTAIRADDEKLQARALAMLKRLFGMPVHHLPGFVLCTLNLSNQVLHPAVTWSLFGADGPEGAVREQVPRFYGACDTAAARLMRQFGLEIRGLASRLEEVVGYPLARWMPADPQARLAARMWSVFPWPFVVDRLVASGVRANRRINRALAPMVPKGDGFVPDFGSRFWTDDIPHGLCVVYGLATLVGYPTPHIQQMIRRQQSLMGRSYLLDEAGDGPGWGPDLPQTNAPQVYGTTQEDLPAFLSW